MGSPEKKFVFRFECSLNKQKSKKLTKFLVSQPAFSKRKKSPKLSDLSLVFPGSDFFQFYLIFQSCLSSRDPQENSDSRFWGDAQKISEKNRGKSIVLLSTLKGFD